MKRLSHHLAVTAAIFTLLTTAPLHAGGNIEAVNAAATNIINATWDARMFPIRYKLNQNVAQGFTSANIRPALDAALLQWENLPENSLDFSWGGTSSANVAAADGDNVLIFNPPSNPGGFVAAAPCTTLTTEKVVTDASDNITGNGIGVIFGTQSFNWVTAPVGTYPRGTNVDCDVIYNVFDVSFTTDGTIGSEDIRTITTHETGHWLSLSHSFFLSATMFPFTDRNIPGDSTGSGGTVEADDVASAGHLYKEAGFDAAYGTITGNITLEGAPGDGVHVTALNADDLSAAVARFSMSRFMDPLDAKDGADFLTNGGGFYRLDGLPPGEYVIYTEWLDDTDESLTGRMGPRYNLSSNNSNVADGGAIGTDARGQLGFLPQRWEFYNAAESADGGNGTPGAGADNPDAATRFTIDAGDVIPGVDIQLNMDPDTGKTIGQRENPTGVQRHDTTPGTNLLGGVGLPADGTNDNYWVIRYPAADLPTPPYNVIEGIWTKNGRADQAYTGGLLLADPGNPNSIEPFISYDPPRLVAGGPNGATGNSELVSIRDRFNVTINDARDIFFVIRQPESSSSVIAEGYYVIANLSDLACTSNGAPCVINPDGSDNCQGGGPSNFCTGGSGNTIFTDDNFATFSGFDGDIIDVLHRARTETAPAVLVTGASPSALGQDDSGIVVTISGAGFKDGAEVTFLSPTYGTPAPSGVTVVGTTFIDTTTLETTVNVAANATPGLLDVQVRNPEVVIPNRARLMSVSAGPDNDSDGYTNAGDCAPGNGDEWMIPGGLNDSVAASEPVAGTVQLSWSPPDVPGGTSPGYNVVRGDADVLRTSAGSDYGSCLASGLASTGTTDADALAAGQIFFYMVSAANSCGSGTYVTPAGNPLRDADPDNC